jgi:Tfp pilus assembly protein PilN
MKNNQRYLQQSSNQIGLLAQQVKDVVPEAVKTDEITGNYSVNYIMLIPMLIESIKKQQEQIDLLKQEVILLRDK